MLPYSAVLEFAGLKNGENWSLWVVRTRRLCGNLQRRKNLAGSRHY